MSVLILESYYRSLPLYKRKGDEKPKVEKR
jgi:hypothetical protein